MYQKNKTIPMEFDDPESESGALGVKESFAHGPGA